jgi:hypothetical protein
MIALAVTLVLALMNIMTSVQRSMELSAISSSGDAHFQFLDVTPEQIRELKKQKEIEWAGEYMELHNLTANISKNTAWLTYIESLGIMDGFKITRGRTPEKANEVAMSPYVAEYLGIEAKVGIEFEAEIIEYDYSVEPTQTVTKSAKFVISGIVQEQEFFKIWDFYAFYVSKEFVNANAPQETSNVLAKLKKGYNVYDIAPTLARIIGVETDKIGYNYTYLF